MSAFVDDLKKRIASNRPTRWVRFALVSAVFFAWVAWLGNWWVALWWLLLIDIYITGYIPLTWWKKSKSATTRSVMSWVDAIVYALVLVYFVFAFVGQNYQIPSSSLEKTLLTGDYLWVNKTAYGPRVPMTPLHFPLVQNTMPIVGTRSYLENPQWKYHRLKGMGAVKWGDIVVFNFPAGDSIAVKAQNPDIYSLSRQLGEEMLTRGMIRLPEGTHNDPIMRDKYLRAVGMEYIRMNPSDFGELMWRPVDRRENYVKRAVGLPGQVFEIRHGEIFTDGVLQPMPEQAQFRYAFSLSNWANMTEADRQELWEDLGVSKSDRISQPGNTMFTPPLTAEAVEKLKRNPELVFIERCDFRGDGTILFPLATAREKGWTLDDYGPLTIPAKGMTVKLDADGWATYGHAIGHYEGHDAEWRDGQAWIDGQPADEYTFTMDYYFMMGDNRHLSLDSRFWGFVPEDHIVGQPVMVLVSFDSDKPWYNKIRWNRLFKSVKNIM
ncbi:MAG: S26 family signal peptidase [Muribaculaceae bacterium]|nr:S26 family signal peptidase [Muribaculaceae bacterium]